jgi:hypothetical protein
MTLDPPPEGSRHVGQHTLETRRPAYQGRALDPAPRLPLLD